MNLRNFVIPKKKTILRTAMLMSLRLWKKSAEVGYSLKHVIEFIFGTKRKNYIKAFIFFVVQTDGPPSRKSLNFSDQSSKTAQSINVDPKIPSTSSAKKRSNDDMYAMLSDDDDDNLKTLSDLDVDIIGKKYSFEIEN